MSIAVPVHNVHFLPIPWVPLLAGSTVHVLILNASRLFFRRLLSPLTIRVPFSVKTILTVIVPQETVYSFLDSINFDCGKKTRALLRGHKSPSLPPPPIPVLLS